MSARFYDPDSWRASNHVATRNRSSPSTVALLCWRSSLARPAWTDDPELADMQPLIDKLAASNGTIQ
jgi:hypothetical protein